MRLCVPSCSSITVPSFVEKRLQNLPVWGGSGLGFLGPEPALGVSKGDIQNKLNCWLGNQLWARRRSLGNNQRQAWELIFGPSLGAKSKVTSFNRTQSRAVIGLLTGHNTPTRHLYLFGLQDSPVCGKCGVMEKTSAHYIVNVWLSPHSDMHTWAPFFGA
jgi:hypothetical protein